MQIHLGLLPLSLQPSIETLKLGKRLGRIFHFQDFPVYLSLWADLHKQEPYLPIPIAARETESACALQKGSQGPG